MDITAFVAGKRETLLIADHATYRAQLSRQILATRKRLGRTTPKREKERCRLRPPADPDRGARVGACAAYQELARRGREGHYRKREGPDLLQAMEGGEDGGGAGRGAEGGGQ